MASSRCTFAASLLCLSLSLVSTGFVAAQQRGAVQKNRVAEEPELRTSTTLHGQIPAWAARINDKGATPDETPLRLTFVLSRSAELQASFTQLLADQQNPNSPNYHQWLTPQQVGEQYGPTQHDVDAFTAWLGSQGLTVLQTAPSRMFVDIVAPTSTVARALATSFHNYDDAGESRLSASTDPTIPAAFASVVSSITGLADLAIFPMHHSETVSMASLSAVWSKADATGPRPQFTNSTGPHYLTPGDFATIFDLKPVYSAGYTGTGQKIAIIGRSRVVASDVAAFEAKTGLVTNVVNTIIPPTGVDPGVTLNADEGEAILDVQRVIGTAPGAQVDLVVSGSAGGFNGIYVAAQYEVQTLLDPVMNISFGACEAYAGPSQVALWDALFSQAASEGISVFVSAADSGAATCNTQFGAPQPNQFRSINYICASSYATCVGGTELIEGTNAAPYWATTNGADGASALSYIPEGAWNEPSNATTGVPTVAATGGGASIFVPKPSWQTGTGVPSDGARDVPDVSFPAARHDAYVICYASSGGDCGNGFFSIFYGTSAAAPAMAGVTALLNQKMGGPQGNMNPLLYRLATNSPSVFHDATPATSGASCVLSLPSTCNNSTPMTLSLLPGVAGYALTTGYDQATGWGSLDVSNLINAAATPRSTLAATALTVRGSATLISNTQTAVFTATLTSSIAGTPGGTVQFYTNLTALGAPVAVTAGKAVTTAMPFPAAGSYFMTAVYSGDELYAATTAPGVSLTVTGLAAITRVTVASTAIPVGTSGTFTATVSPATGTGVPTGSIRFLASGITSDTFVAIAPLVNGVATTPPINFFIVGSYNLIAEYVGDTAYSPSNSVVLPIAVQKLVSTSQLSTVVESIGAGGSKFFTTSISGPATTLSGPTGTVQLYANGVAIGAPSTVIAQTFSPSKGSNLVGFAAPGTYTVTAVYSGDAYWLPSTAAGISLTVLSTPASYQTSSTPAALTVTAGGTGGSTAQVTVLGALGFAGTVSLSCSVAYNGSGAATSVPTCGLSNSAVTVIVDSLGTTSTLSVSTTAAQSSSRPVLSANASSSRSPWYREGGPMVCALLLCLVPIRRRARGSLQSLMTVAVVTAGLLAVSGCGGGGSTGSSSNVSQGTTRGSYTITVTASTPVAGIAVPAPVTIALTVN
jgi:pseudomonalisin